MITSTSTNFGVNPISFKCYDSAKIVVLQGLFLLDTGNEDYLAAEQLEITFPDQFSIPDSKPTTAFLVCQKDDLQSGTIIKGQLQGNKLILEKLSIYDGIGTVKVVLASGFVGEASEAQLSPIPSGLSSVNSSQTATSCLFHRRKEQCWSALTFRSHLLLCWICII